MGISVASAGQNHEVLGNLVLSDVCSGGSEPEGTYIK